MHQRVVQPKWLSDPKSMSLSWPGLYNEQHIIEGHTLNSLLWS